MNNGGWGIGDWGLGIGDWGPIPNPQSPNQTLMKKYLMRKNNKNNIKDKV